MALTEKEEFRLRFLEKCADLGLTKEEILGKVKEAEGGLGAAALNLLGPVAKLPFYAGLGAVATGGVLGAAGGHLLAKATQRDIDPETAKQYELIAALQQHADRARRAAKLNYRDSVSKPSGPKLFP